MAGYGQATEGEKGSRWFRIASVCAGQCSIATKRTCKTQGVYLEAHDSIDSKSRAERFENKIEWHSCRVDWTGEATR